MYDQYGAQARGTLPTASVHQPLYLLHDVLHSLADELNSSRVNRYFVGRWPVIEHADPSADHGGLAHCQQAQKSRISSGGFLH